MSTYPSEQQKSLDMRQIILILWYIMVIGILMVRGFNINMGQGSLNRTLGGQSHVSVDSNISFASDESYWNANCSHGWSGNSTCDEIVIRAQSCEISNISAYCSDYRDYLQLNNK